MSDVSVVAEPNTSQLMQDRLLRILELTQKLAQPHDLSSMLEQVLEAGLDVLQAESGSLWLYDAARNVINMHLPVLATPISVSVGQGLVGECLATNKVINVPDCYADPRFNSSVDKGTGFKTRSLLSVPLVGVDEAQIGVLQLLNKRGGPFDEADERIAVTLAAQSAVALQRAQGMEAMLAKERQDEEIALARDVQMSTLPEEMPAVRDYDFATGFVPADFTGGDLYDLVEINGEVFILVGDATGHGIAPALSATQMQAMFRVAFRVGASLDQAYIHVNNQMVEDLQDNKFLTAFIGFLNHEQHTLRYHSAGQGPLVHYRAAANQCDFHPPTSFPVGVMEIDEVAPPREILLNQGDIFAVISDGVFEFENAAGEQFGERRLAELIQSFAGDSMEALKEAIIDALAGFAEGAAQLDDITIVLMRRVQDSEHGPVMKLNCARNITELDRIVAATHAFCKEQGVGSEIWADVDFAIEELFVNQVKYHKDTVSEIEISMTAVPGGVSVTLIDHNVERYDPRERPPVDVTLPAEQRNPGGLGVFLTLKLVDSFSYDYHDRTSTINFIKLGETRDV